MACKQYFPNTSKINRKKILLVNQAYMKCTEVANDLNEIYSSVLEHKFQRSPSGCAVATSSGVLIQYKRNTSPSFVGIITKLLIKVTL